MTSENLMVWLTMVLTVLTLVIAGLTLLMVFLVRKQWRVQEASEERWRQRDEFRVKVSERRHRMGPTFSGGLAEFTVANEGLVDVEIHSFAFEVGALRKGTPGDSTAEIHLHPEKPDHGPAVTIMSLPHRLQPAESFSVFFDRDRLVEESARLGDGEPARLRPFCHDSLGRKFFMGQWITYVSDLQTSLGYEPGEDRISEEDLRKLSPVERQLYDGWGAKYVPARGR